MKKKNLVMGCLLISLTIIVFLSLIFPLLIDPFSKTGNLFFIPSNIKFNYFIGAVMGICFFLILNATISWFKPNFKIINSDIELLRFIKNRSVGFSIEKRVDEYRECVELINDNTDYFKSNPDSLSKFSTLDDYLLFIYDLLYKNGRFNSLGEPRKRPDVLLSAKKPIEPKE